MSFIRAIKNLVKRYFVRERIVPVPIVTVKEQLLQGKCAIVTGGSSGIGYGISRKFIESGCSVIIVGSNEDKLKKAAMSLQCDYLQADIKNISHLQQKMSTFLAGRKIDILVNSAGYHGTDPFGSVTEETWNAVLDVNVKGLYFMSQIVANHMIENHIKGHILNISSASALKPSWTPYEISKRAVSGITLGFAHKLIPYGIVVNALGPGPTSTPMLHFEGGKNENLQWIANPSGRVSTVEEIANLALFMASDMGNGIVGDTFYMTGGSGTVCIDK